MMGSLNFGFRQLFVLRIRLHSFPLSKLHTHIEHVVTFLQEKIVCPHKVVDECIVTSHFQSLLNN